MFSFILNPYNLLLINYLVIIVFYQCLISIDWFHISELDFALFLDKKIYEFLATTVRTLFDKNISNQFYISVQLFNQLFCLLHKIIKLYIYKHILKVFTAHIAVYAYEPANRVRYKHSRYQSLPFKTVKFQIHDGCHPLKLSRVSKIIVTEIGSPHRIINISMHT